MKRYSGFTLIELMVVIAIIAILAGIAIPQYSEYVRRSALVEASSMLADWRVRMEQYYQDNRRYVTTAGGATCGAAAPAAATVRFFTYTCTGADETYTLTATGLANTKGNGFTYTLDEQNVRRTTAVPTGFASISLPATCFVMNKGASSC